MLTIHGLFSDVLVTFYTFDEANVGEMSNTGKEHLLLGHSTTKYKETKMLFVCTALKQIT